MSSRVKMTLTIQIGDLEVKVKADSVEPITNPVDLLNVAHDLLKSINEALVP